MRKYQLIIVLMLAMGCQQGVSSSGREPASQRVAIELSDGTSLVGPPAVIRVYPASEGVAGRVELSVTAGDSETERWALLAEPSEEFLSRGSLILPLTDRPLSMGLAAAQRGVSEGDVTFAVDGSMELSVSKGRITGVVTTGDESISATFEGDVAVLCMPAASPQPGGSVNRVEGGSAVVFATPAAHGDLSACAAAR